MSFRQILGKIGLWFAVFVIVSPAILFFLWMASLSLKYEVDNAAYPPVFSPSALPGRTTPTCSRPTAS
jgi:multiple sugar transport system permease protein